MRPTLLVILGVALLFPTVETQAKSKLDQVSEFIHKGRQLGAGLSEIAQAGQVVRGLEYQRHSYGVLNHQGLEAGLNEVLEELRAQAPVNAPPARVYATPAPAFEAYSFGDGTIVITAGVLESLQSRDELAALIAHEYAHVVLRHHEQSRLGTLAEQAYGLGSLYLGYRFTGESIDATNLDSTATRQFLLNELAMESVQSGLVPKRSRDEEATADKRGVDLLIGAGYNHLAFDTLLTRMGEWEARNQQLAEQNDAHGQEVEKWLTADRRGISTDLAPLANEAAKRVTQGAMQLLGKLRRKHKDADSRRDDLAEHVDARHPDASYPELRSLPWSLDATVARLFEDIARTHQVRDTLIGGNRAAAREGASQLQASSLAATPYSRFVVANVESGWAALDQEAQQPDSLFSVHTLLLDLLERQDAALAVEALERSRQVLGNPDGLLPYGVRLYKRVGNEAAAAEYLSRCVASGSRELRNVCAQGT